MIEEIGKDIYESIEEFVEDYNLMNEYEDFLISLGEDRDVMNKDDITSKFLDDIEQKIMFISHSKGEGIIITL